MMTCKYILVNLELIGTALVFGHPRISKYGINQNELEPVIHGSTFVDQQMLNRVMPC